MTKTKTNELALVQQQVNKIRVTLQSPEIRARITEGAHPGVSVDRVITSFLLACHQNPAILKCDVGTILASLRELAFYDLELGGILGEAYLVPYGDRCQLIPGYKGLIKMCRNSGAVGQIDMEIVREGDHFVFTKGEDARIEHTPMDAGGDDRPPTHAYVIVHLKGGFRQREVWTRQAIDHHKEAYSQTWKRPDSPWQKHWDTMAKKTVLRSMIARGKVPMATAMRDTILREENPQRHVVWPAKDPMEIEAEMQRESAELFEKGSPEAT